MSNLIQLPLTADSSNEGSASTRRSMSDLISTSMNHVDPMLRGIASSKIAQNEYPDVSLDYLLTMQRLQFLVGCYDSPILCSNLE